MGGNYSRLATRNTGATIDGPTDDAEFDNIIANSTPTGLDDASENLAAMQTAVDPYPGGSESLPTSTAGELQRLRFLLKQLTTTNQWYIFPDLVSKTAAYTATLDDRIILGDATSAAFSVTLPTAVGNTDKIYYVKKTDASGNAVTVDADGTEEIDGSLTQVLAAQYDFIVIVSDGANWQTFAGLARPDGSIIQSVWTQDGTLNSGTTQLPNDDSIPQITEGDEYMTLAITPTSTTSRLFIEVVWHGSSGITDTNVFVALFKDAVSNALASSLVNKTAGANVRGSTSFNHEVVAGTISEITFRVRAGTAAAGTTRFNGNATGQLHGGVLASSIRITEIKA